jgi:HEAT repeat protein
VQTEKVLLLLFVILNAAYATDDWRAYARRLSGEAKHVRVEMIEKLKAIPNLDGHLRSAFRGPDRFLAFDVLSALEKRDFLDEILKLIPQDPSGFAVHAANSLSRPDDRMKLVDTYRGLLTDPRPTAPTRMALFDTLGRLGALLSEEVCQSGLKDPSPEVRTSALHYLRHAILKLGQRDWVKRLEPALQRNQPWQVRAQTVFLISEIPARERRGLIRKTLPAACDGLPEGEPLRLCNNFARLENAL